MTDRCSVEALRSVAGKLLDTDLKEIRAEADRILEARRHGLSEEDARAEIRKAAIERVKSAKLRKAQIADSHTKEARITEAALTEFKSKPWQAFQALIGNVAGVARGARASVQTFERQFIQKYLGGMRSRLLEDGPELDALWASGRVDKEVSRALWELTMGRDPNGLVAQGRASENAVKIARAVHDVNSLTIVDGERRLINIEATQFYVARTSHDRIALEKAGFDAWFKVFKEAYDLRIPGDEEAFRTVARNFYLDATADVFKQKTDPRGLTGYRSRARLNAHERAFIPKNADQWHAYNQQFGGGNLRETFTQTVLGRAKDYAFADVAGVTPEASIFNAWQKTLDSLREQPKLRRKMDQKEQDVRDIVHKATGALDEPGNDTVAQINQVWRNSTRMAIYGGSVLAQPPDIAFAAAELRYQAFDRGGTERGLLSYAGDVVRGLRVSENKEALRYLEYVANDYIHFLGEEGSMQRGAAGWTARQTARFFKINLMTAWTNRLQVQLGALTSMNFGSWSGRTFDKLPEGSRNLFAGHNIGAREWDVIRQGAEKAENGSTVISARAIRALPDDVFKGYDGSRSVESVKDDIASMWRGFLHDRIATGSNQPGYRTRATLTGGTQAGTWAGEMWRNVAMVKSFPVEVIYSSIGRELFGYGATNIKEAFTQGASGLGFARMFAMTTVLGYLSMSARDALQGKEPRDPFDSRTMMMAMLRGGALSIYGDMLFGAAEKRWGANIVTAAMGPQFQQISDVADIGGRALKIHNRGDDEKLAATTIRTIYRNLPGNNLFFVKPIVDYTFMYGLLDDLSPGYLRRMERTLERETGQTYYLNPSERRYSVIQ